MIEADRLIDATPRERESILTVRLVRLAEDTGRLVREQMAYLG